MVLVLATSTGAQFVTTRKSGEGQRLAVGKLKHLNHGNGRNQDVLEVRPQQVPGDTQTFLGCKPQTDPRRRGKGRLERPKPIPFPVTISPEQMDKTLIENVKTEFS